MTTPSPPPAPTAAGGPAAPGRTGLLRHLVAGLAVLVGGAALATPAVWRTMTWESARVADGWARSAERANARTRALVDAGELPAGVLDQPWEPVLVDPVTLGTVVVAATPLGAAALAGFLLAGRPRRGRSAAVAAAALVLVWSSVLRALGPSGLPHAVLASVPPYTWSGVPTYWEESPFVLLPAVTATALVLAGAVLARPAPPGPRAGGPGVVVGAAVAALLGAVVALDLVATARWTWSPDGLAAPLVLLAAVAWLAADAPATPLLGGAAMLAAATPYLVEGWTGMTLVHAGVTAAAVVAVTLAGLRRRATTALARLVV